MINRLKAQLIVYRPAIHLALMIITLIVLGLVGGFLLGRADANQRVRHLEENHSYEITRMQTSNHQVIVYLVDRVRDLIKEQERLAALVAEGVQEARKAAKSAKASSAQAASSVSKAKADKNNIRITEVPAAEQENLVEDRHQFPERIEH